MEPALVVIEDADGGVGTGHIVTGEAREGAHVTISLHDENGMPMELCGTVIEIL